MLLAEFEATASRPRIASLLPVGIAERFLMDVQGAARMEPDPKVVSISRDPKDDYLVALAIAIDADHVVTGDAAQRRDHRCQRFGAAAVGDDDGAAGAQRRAGHRLAEPA